MTRMWGRAHQAAGRHWGREKLHGRHSIRCGYPLLDNGLLDPETPARGPEGQRHLRTRVRGRQC